MVKIFIDCEFNGFNGELISMALVPADSSPVFYEWLGCENPTVWVAENVIPKIGGIMKISLEAFQNKLQAYLMQFDECHIVADWPDDIAYLCRALITGPGRRIDTPPLTLEVTRIDAVSNCPHFALADAFALRMAYLSEQKAHADTEKASKAGEKEGGRFLA